MKIGIISDIHGRDLKAVEKEFKARKIDYGICLGDFDRAHIARQMKEMQEKDSPCPWYVVPGNHDHSHVYKVPIKSGMMNLQGITSEQMQKEWDLPENSDVKAYVKTLLHCGPPKERCGRSLNVEIPGFKRSIAIHGALDGDRQCPPVDLWTRLRKVPDHEKNFAEMEKKENDYQVMLRGHDHEPAYACKDKKGVVQYKGFQSLSGNREKGKRFDLPLHVRHTVNPGTYFLGYFAIIDTEERGAKFPVLTYHKVLPHPTPSQP